ncbi:sulfurtransferase complex subunit TusB [Microbulbifer spongiae]|uniref:Sulfurtransferase complex subunit TusB n=1 Tax=Microbulbifer spongiae TaxID=2944933 RepID=A0ABY9EFX0_9GAMM|nr:sulfurtransferase complex subunit TusB [Microbulbifer sp. MI-G]WKD51415.1 sulfurtransferase complex subunit TusB [Microbulbifer sp. MI-G]
MTLHIVNKSPFSSNALQDCLENFAQGDVLLLIEDGVYALQGDFFQTIPDARVYCLEADTTARAQSAMSTKTNVEVIDDVRWVQLCTKHNPIVSWFR